MNKIAILITDLSGYNNISSTPAAYLRERYIRLVYQSLAGKSYILDGKKDQLVIVSTDTDDIAKTLMKLYKKVANEKNLLPVHAGLHYGEVQVQRNHFFGTTFNISARIAARAKEGIILASREFMNTLSCPESFHYIRHDELRFKDGFDSVEIMELLPEYNVVSAGDHAGYCKADPADNKPGFKYNYARKRFHFYSSIVGKLTMQHLLNFSKSSAQLIA
ncbi:MAG: hypothetical protein ABIN67_18370 [Ferruginibacter sp.]